MKKSNIKILNELLENHDWFSRYSDDHRMYKLGGGGREAIHKFIYLNGGWDKEVLNTWNKHAPDEAKYDMEWVVKFFIKKDSNYIKDMERKYKQLNNK